MASRLAEKKAGFFRGAGGKHRLQENLQTGAVRQVRRPLLSAHSLFSRNLSFYFPNFLMKWNSARDSDFSPLLAAGWSSWRLISLRISWGSPTSTSWKWQRTMSCCPETRTTAPTFSSAWMLHKSLLHPSSSLHSSGRRRWRTDPVGYEWVSFQRT